MSVCSSDSLVCETYVVHHINGTGLNYAPPTCAVHKMVVSLAVWVCVTYVVHHSNEFPFAYDIEPFRSPLNIACGGSSTPMHFNSLRFRDHSILLEQVVINVSS